jgi:hypothetical protein
MISTNIVHKNNDYLFSLENQVGCVKPRRVKFELNKLKIENLAGYFNDQVIDLTPPFQRGRVWTIKMRQGLLKNILQGKPVPAIFLYKTQEGAKNIYIILDGKQRLESILLYIGDQRSELRISQWREYIFGSKNRKQLHFKAEVNGKQKNLKGLSNDEAAKFRDYSLSIIEIDFDDEVTLIEIIQLFVDINQSGVKMGRFDIVKAVYLEDPMLKQIFGLLAETRQRGKDVSFKIKNTPFSLVLKKLDIVSRVEDQQSRVNIMWQRLWELALFTATGMHRKPSQILKDFISRNEDKPNAPKLTDKQIKLITKVFKFLKEACKNPKFLKTRWATDNTHFYILATSMIDELKQADAQSLADLLPLSNIEKLIKFDCIINGSLTTSDAIKSKIADYTGLSVKQTTDATKRQDRTKLFREILKAIP